MNIEQDLKKHFEEDKKNFKNIDDNLTLLLAGQKKTHDFMENLGWLSDISKGTQLLKRPSLWLVAFVLGIVALMGGLKAMIGALVGWVTLK